MKAKAVYALCGNKAGKETTLFLGNGTLLQTPRVTIKSENLQMFCWNINWMGGIMKPLPIVRLQ